jgi:hypothetical protein
MPDLTTLEVVRAWLAIPTNQTGSDTILSSLISAVSADFLRAIGRTDFLTEDYVEVREGDGGNRLVTRHWPITEISSLTVAGATVAAQVEPGVAGYFTEAGLDPERLNEIYLQGSTFTDAAQVIVSYSGGYEAAPDDVAQAVAEWVATRFKIRPESTVSTQRSAAGEHVTYEKDPSMPSNTARVIEKYTRNWPSLDKFNDDRNYRVTRINRTYTTVEKPS